MSRKYKFFIKDASVIFTDDLSLKKDKELVEGEWYRAFEKQSVVKSSTVFCANLDEWMSKLRQRFDFVQAGGGFVTNQKDELLMIHRRGFWDLPKGKLDPVETIEQCAKREVEEETGVGELEINSKAFTTYHLYTENKETVVKESHWYGMTTKSKNEPVAQTEEDIEKAIWVKLPVKEKQLGEAYASIQDVIGHYLGIR